MDTAIHVCYAFNDLSGTYTKFVGTSLCSIFENTQSPVVAHVLHDDTLNEENKNRLVVLAGDYGQKICFYNILTVPSIREFIGKIQQIYLPQYQGMLFRFAMGELLPSSIERAIYLDADTIVNMDIAKLWNVELGNAHIAAVSDSVIAMLPMDLVPVVVKNGLVQQDKYFNSGVLLMDMNFFSEYRQITDDVIAFLLRDGINTEYPDQDFLNCAFDESCRLLPIEYNFLVNYARMQKMDKKEAIFHYAGGALKLDTNDAFDTLFWHYLCKTPWQNEKASMRSLSYLGQNCRELAERSNLLTLLLGKPKRLIFGSRVLASKVELCLNGTFYDSGEDETTNLQCGDLIDVFFSLPADERVLVIISKHYKVLKKMFEGIGLKKGSDFVDGYILTLPEKKAAEFKDSAIIGRY